MKYRFQNGGLVNAQLKFSVLYKVNVHEGNVPGSSKDRSSSLHLLSRLDGWNSFFQISRLTSPKWIVIIVFNSEVFRPNCLPVSFTTNFSKSAQGRNKIHGNVLVVSIVLWRAPRADGQKNIFSLPIKNFLSKVVKPDCINSNQKLSTRVISQYQHNFHAGSRRSTV